MKQTELGLDDLVRMINNGEDKECLLTSEIGEIMDEGGQEASQAESYLRDVLKGNGIAEIRALAYCWLATSQKISQITFEIVKRFKKNPENKEVLEKASLAFQRRN
jgi:hypothetical protein